MIVLAGDIGGTHARLGLFRMEAGGAPELLDERTVSSKDHSGPAPIVTDFLAAKKLSAAEDLGGVCVAVAGPVRDGVVRVPNLGWVVEVERFAADIGCPGATLINDFEAVGHGVPALEAADYAKLQAGSDCETAPITVLGPGTGLGHVFLMRDGSSSWLAQSSEAGHADFVPRTAVEWALAEDLTTRYGHASWERVVSGPGLADIYRFLASREGDRTGILPLDALESDEGPALISRRAQDGDDRLCALALDIFVSALGALAGNLVLTLGAYGGVYLAGGIAPQILEQLRGPCFLEAFRAKGRLSDMLDRVPVRVILDRRIGLKGAARRAGAHMPSRA